MHSIYAGVIRYCVCWSLDLVKLYAGKNVLHELDNVFMQYFRIGSSIDGEFTFIVPKKGISSLVRNTTASSNRELNKKNKHKKQSSQIHVREKRKRSSHTSNEKHTSKFRSKAWGAVAVALYCTLVSSPLDKFLPSNHRVYGRVRDTVVQGLNSVINLLFELNRVEFTERGLQQLESTTIPGILTHVKDIHTLRANVLDRSTNFNGIKLHIILHIPHLIRRFGAPCNWDTNTFETSHKSFVLMHWNSGPKRTDDLELNTLKSVSSSNICYRDSSLTNRLV